jgi:hypothetical protein
MKHPDPKIQRNQDSFIENCPDEDKEFHKRLFRTGNAAYIYHQQAASTSNKVSEEYFHEWLDGLPDNIKNDMQMKGFEACKTMFPFTRYVNERNDIGMDEWMKNHLSDDDFNFWLNSAKTKL